MSTMLYMSVISVSPTKGAVSPLATVETMSLGIRKGRARRAAAEVREVPDEPPMAITPWIGSVEYRSSKEAVAHWVMMCMTSDRWRVEKLEGGEERYFVRSSF